MQFQVVPDRTPWTLDVARWSAATVSFQAVLRAGSVLFAGELERLRLRRLSGHVMVCGLGRKITIEGQSYRRRATEHDATARKNKTRAA
jgi:hypothetical protein